LRSGAIMKRDLGKNLFKKFFWLQFQDFGVLPKKIFPLNFQLNIKICLSQSVQNPEISPKNYFLNRFQLNNPICLFIL